LSLFLILKLVTVLFFLLMFLRGSRLVWGIGLLTVTTAVLLDTILNAFGRDELMSQFGFFFYVIAGAVFAGAALWLWGLLYPATAEPAAVAARNSYRSSGHNHREPHNPTDTGNTAFDRQMLYDQIRYRFGPDDVYDLIFDLAINENDVIEPGADLRQTIINVMDLAEQRGQAAVLALAVERILTPLAAEHLPRLQKLNADSPHTVLRQFLLAHYSLEQLEQMVIGLGIDWEQLEGAGKKGKVRSFLLYLYRRNRLDELLDRLQNPQPVSPV
jgi:hypothetical protein